MICFTGHSYRIQQENTKQEELLHQKVQTKTLFVAPTFALISSIQSFSLVPRSKFCSHPAI